MQWLPTRFYGSLSVYSRPLPSEKNSPFAALLKIAFRRFLFIYKFSLFFFSHDVTKIQTKKLSILPRFYFHDALEQPKTNFHKNFRFKRVQCSE